MSEDSEKSSKTKKAKLAKKSKASEQKNPNKKSEKKAKVQKKKLSELEVIEIVQKELATNQTEIVTAIKNELEKTFEKELKRANSRRRWNNFFRDILIMILIGIIGFLGYCSYNHVNLWGETTSSSSSSNVSETSAGPVKDSTWYLTNYRYLFDQIQGNFNADSVSAYYLYSNDLNVNQIKSTYLLNIAYSRYKQNRNSSNSSFNEEDLSGYFKQLFGSDVSFVATSFTSGCDKVEYQKEEKKFTISTVEECSLNQHREIIEEIEKIYEEGEMIYIVTTAGIYDKDDKAFFSFDDLFQPVVKNVEKSEFSNFSHKLNRYQYQFKKSDESYHLNKITKL